MTTRASRIARVVGRAAWFAAPAAVACALALAPGDARAATRLFIVNHVASNDVRALTEWNGSLALATNGGIVFADTATGATSKVLRSPGGLPSNNLLAIAASPSGLLWIGTADAGLARMRSDGTFLRTLTSFDGLPSDRVQTIYRAGDSLWVGTSGGVALFTENATTGQLSLRRSDSSASTGGALVSDDVTSFAAWNDTLWVGTNGGLSAFTAGTWMSRTTVNATRVQALALVRDSLWIGTKTNLRVYAPGGPTQTRGTLIETLALTAFPWGVGRGTAIGALVYPPNGTEALLPSIGLPLSRVQALRTTARARVFAGTPAGLARFEGGLPSWTAVRSKGPEGNGGVRVSASRGNVWITMGNAAPPGLSIGVVLRYAAGAWTYLTEGTTGGHLQSAGAFGVLGAADGRLWVGHCCSGAGGDSRPRTDRWEPVSDAWDRPPAYNLWSLTQGPAGRVYGVGVEYENGVYAFDASSGALLDSLTPDNTNGGLTRNNLRGIAFDGLGRAWIGTVDNGVDRWDGKGTDDHADDAWAHFRANFANTQTTSVGVVADNEAWVGTRGGAVRILNDVVDLTATSKINLALQGNAVNDLAVDSDGAVWLATSEGLARVSKVGAIEVFTVADGLASDDVSALAWDAERSTLWAVTAGGVSEIHPSPSDQASFGDGSYVYPNPASAANSTVRLGGITGALTGEIRDVSGTTIRTFTANPATPAVWDLRDRDGRLVAPGIYLVVLRQGDLKRVLRVAVTR